MNEVEDFLAHYGKKGMKWGVRRKTADRVETASPSSRGRAQTSDDAGSKDGTQRRRMSPETKRKLAIGAGIVGAAAVIAVGAYAANKHMDTNKVKAYSEMRKQVETRRAGEAAAKKTLASYNQKAKWKPSTHSKTNRAGKRAAAEEVSNFSQQRIAQRKAFADRVAANQAAKANRQRKVNVFTPTGRAKNKADDLANTKRQIDAFAKKSKWELAARPAAKAPSKRNVMYNDRDARKDAKLYGAKGQARIQKQVDNGSTLSGARQREATRQNGLKAIRLAMNVKSAQRRESAEYDRLRKRGR